jgi:preprotein translocase subunit SecD
MNEFPKWKIILVSLILVLGFIYALPNVFPSVPAVQISANRGATVDEALKEKVLGVLQTKKIAFKDVQLQGERLLARFDTPDVQLAAQDAL